MKLEFAVVLIIAVMGLVDVIGTATLHTQIGEMAVHQEWVKDRVQKAERRIAVLEGR